MENILETTTNKNTFAFLLGCDIDGWTKGTTNEEQKDWAQAVQNLVKEGIDDIIQEYDIQTSSPPYLTVPTGDGAHVAFFDSKLLDAPLKLAAFLTSHSKNLPCTLGLALHCGIVSLIQDCAGHPNLTGDGISDLSRVLQNVSNWQIAITSGYADYIENLDRDTRCLISATPVVREDKHGKKHYLKFISGRYRHTELGRPQSQEHNEEEIKRKVDLASLSDLPSWLSLERRQKIRSDYNAYITGGRLKEERTSHIKRLKNSTRKTLQSHNSPAWVSLATTDSPAGYRLAFGFQNRGCSYRCKDDPLKLGCFHCGFYAGSRALPKGKETSSLQMQFYRALQYGFERGVRFDVIEFLSDGSFLDDNEVPERTKSDLFNAIRNMPSTKRVLVESVPGKVFDQRGEVMERLNDLREDQELEIGIGFETADDFIRQVTLNKGTLKETFEEAVRHLANLPPDKKRRVRPVAYLFVKPPWLTEEESIKDCIKSIEYLHALSCETRIDIVPKLEPAIISEGTLLNLLWRNGEYLPLNYWAILEILTRLASHPTCSHIIQKIRIGTRSDMDDSAKLPGAYRPDGRFDQYDFILYRGLQQFNQHHDLSAVFGLLQAMYLAGKNNILDKDQSLTPWINSVFPGEQRSECAILNFMNIYKEKIDAASIQPSVTKEEKYTGKLFKFLDFIEGYSDGENKYVKSAPKWCKRLIDAESVENVEAVRAEMEEEMNQLLRTQLSYSEVRVMDVYTETEANTEKDYLLRARLEIVDFLQNNVYQIWAGTPATI